MNDSRKNEQALRTAVFDVCDTLYYSNTTHDFVRFVMERERMSPRKLAYSAVNSRVLPLRYALIYAGIRSGRDVMKSLNVAKLKGKTRDELFALAREFTSKFLDTRRIAETQRLISEQKGQGLRVVLCSSSIEPVVAAVAEDLSVDHFAATTLEYDGDIFTGRIAEDITKDKLGALERRGLGGEIAYAASDNVSDLALLSAAEKAVVIIHGTRKQEFWRKYQFETINLNL